MAKGHFQDFLEFVRSRRSIRRYLAEPVPWEVIERVLEAATWAPSAHNRQPWRFVVITEMGAKEGLARAMGEQLRSDRLAAGDDPTDVEVDAGRSHARITSAPVIVIACLTMEDMDVYPDARRSSAEHMMAVQGVAMAVGNLCLAAADEGLGACWMCAPLFCSETVASELELPAGWEAQALVTLGYPASAGKAARRRPLAEVVLPHI